MYVFAFLCMYFDDYLVVTIAITFYNAWMWRYKL